MALLVANLQATCFLCQTAQLVVPAADVTGMTFGEVLDALEKNVTFIKAGWSVRTHPNPKIRRYTACPACLKESRKVSLQPFESEVTCPKCGYPTMSCEFMSGAESTALVPMQHIQRTCSRCKFKLVQAPLDAQLRKEA